MKAKFSSPKMSSTIDLEKEIINSIREDAKIPLASEQTYKSLIKLVKKLFNEYRGERLYTTNTILGLLKGDK
tara:strand:+ start:74 stop:289 length:216 start_codon:yes stop_codon:yes gene_type:complete